MKLVIVRLGNGLGNQLFTYAAAFAFAKKHKAKLYVDDESGFYKRYKYELHNLEISADIVKKSSKFIGVTGKMKRRILKRINIYKKNKIFLIEKADKEKLTYFQPEQFDVNFNKKIYFEGYFQSEKYFEKEKQSLLKEFTFKKEIINQKSLFLNDIEKSNSISIHFRQDKYLLDEGHKNLKELNFKNFENNINIIKRGISFFDKEINNPKYFIWSDNFSGLKELFNEKNFTLVNENLSKDPAYDLFLMSRCKHFIMSPSTFHYWSAFLSPYEKKICIAPYNTFNRSGYYGFSNNKDIKPNWWKEI